MKDYYKILGVREDASGEEIRSRYVELAKRHHPDLKKTVEEGDKIKEINEAYEALKDPSSRMDYDLRQSLKRAYLKKRGKEKERLWLTKKAVFPMSILFVFIIIFSLFLWKRLSVHVQSSSVTYHPIVNPAAGGVKHFGGGLNSTLEGGTSYGSEPGMAQKSNPAVGGTATAGPDASQEGETLAHRKKQDHISDGEKRVIENPLPLKTVRKPEPEVPAREVISKTSPAVHQEKPGDIQINSMVTAAALKEVISLEPTQKIEQKSQPAPVEAKSDSTIHPPPITSKPEPPINFTLSSPPLLVEEEVRLFLGRYVERYVRKDIHGFLALFSSKAIQNGKEGLEKIREVYVRFFDQSEELNYRLEDLRILINGGEAEAMAHYQVTQRLKNRSGEKLWRGNLRWMLVKEDGALKILSLDYQHTK
jgi:curved DNA-binding protein CbpA